MKSNKNSFCSNIKSKINKKYAIIIGVSAIILIILIIVIVAVAIQKIFSIDLEMVEVYIQMDGMIQKQQF